MSELQIGLLVVDAVLWIGLVFVKAMQLPKSPISTTELHRRADNADQVAKHELWRESLLPRIGGLKWLVETVFIFSSITILFQTLKPFSAVLLSIVLLLVTDMAARNKWAGRRSRTLYRRHEPVLLPRVERWSWLDWFKRAESSQSLQVSSREELAELIERSGNDVLGRDDKAMLSSQLAFTSKIVGDVMTPKTMIDSVQVIDGIGPLVLDSLHKTGHSRFPVIDKDVDHVVGMLYLHDLVALKTGHNTVKEAIDDHVYYIGEGRTLEHALYAFLRTHHHLFIVVNEYRETVGLLSLEDVIEALIGRQIIDEFDEFHDLRAVAASNPKANNAPKGKKDI